MATAPTSYASALIESLRTAPSAGMASDVLLLPNPVVEPVAIQPRALRPAARGGLNAPPILSMPAFVPQETASIGGDGPDNSDLFNSTAREPFFNDLVFNDVQRVTPIEPEMLPAIEEPWPLVDPNDIPVPDLEPFMPVVSPSQEPEPQPAETFPVPDQAPWEPVDLPPMLPDAPEPEAPQEPSPAETFPVSEPAPWEPIDLPPMVPPEPQPEPEPEPVPDYTEDLWPSIEEVLLAQEPLLTEQDFGGDDFNLPSDEELMAIFDFFGRGDDFEVDYLSY